MDRKQEVPGMAFDLIWYFVGALIGLALVEILAWIIGPLFTERSGSERDN